MDSEKNPDGSNVHYIKRAKRLMSRTRLVMVLLLIVAIPIFIGLANKAVRENAQVIRQISRNSFVIPANRSFPSDSKPLSPGPSR
jgi:hypothetical protein